MKEKILYLGDRQVLNHEKVLFRRGEKASKIFYLKRGLVQLSNEIEGKFSLVDKGGFLGIIEAFTDQTYTSTASVVGDAEIVTIDFNTFRKVFHNDAELRAFIIRNLSNEVNERELYFE